MYTTKKIRHKRTPYIRLPKSEGGYDCDWRPQGYPRPCQVFQKEQSEDSPVGILADNAENLL